MRRRDDAPTVTERRPDRQKMSLQRKYGVMVLLSVLVIYGICELAARHLMLDRDVLRDAHYLERARAKADAAGVPLADVGQVLPIDPELGWIGRDNVHNPGRVDTVLFMGDSVTYGLNARKGGNHFVRRLADRWPVRIVNGAVSGYGLDQMVLKLRRDIAEYSPAAIVLAYIPHDLARVTMERFVGMTKPRFEWTGQSVQLQDPAPIETAYVWMDRADRFGLMTVYAASRLVDIAQQRRAQRDIDAFSRVLDALVARLEAIAQDIPVLVVAIPNRARGSVAAATLDQVADERFRAAQRQGAITFTRLEQCVDEHGPFAEFVLEHPGPEGHATLARCMQETVEPWLARHTDVRLR